MVSEHPALPGIAYADWGRIGYGPALDRQRAWNQQIQERARPETLVVLEHEPVITVSRRPAAKAHLLADAAQLARLGIEVCETDRGGDITYHGPGQLVAYPMVRIKPMGLGIAEYMRFLETVVMDVLAAFALRGERVAGKTGVWVRQDDGGMAKLCAMGVRVRRGVTMHGLALNVSPDLRHFETIVPCGLPDPVTGLGPLLRKPPPMDAVKAALSRAFKARWAEAIRAARG